MKNFTINTSSRILIAIILLFLINYSGYSQCTPNDCSTILPPFGGICDSSFVEGTSNEAYSDFESFHITTTCFDAGILDPSFSGTNVSVEQIDNLTFFGLPNGITGTSNQISYSSPANGCISISGTPSEAGEFQVNVFLLADVLIYDGNCSSVVSVQNDNQITVPLTLTILPDASFTIPSTSFAACDEAVSLSPTGTVGGSFSGPGVSGSTFNPSVAGPGSHTITYSVSAQEGEAVGPASNSSSITVNVSALPEPGIDTQTACDSFTWIDGNTYTESNNTATFNIEGGAANGCDSLVMLNLTIDTISDLTTSTDGSTITVNNTNVTYQWLDCNNNYAIIPGETNQSFTPVENGTYAAELTKNSCVDTTACVEINTLGIIDNDFGDDLKVYPNPTDGNFSIEMGGYFKNVEISIFEIDGKLIRSAVFNNQKTIDLTITEKPGIYLIGISAENKKATIRLLKE
ncbi:T9SS type A sorting domain-containing protein [Mangrovivirga sp. M17]|uniref:T9SS type A sorting domain-containing protein n=1 Tax=Mangrovivirga halotolerans TaxID=2993936 RepID=A0ABT3RS34_9BACT|nr:T9SS type A sorting domain-containing protein [Mangrovivirga halotolerans]MCX2744378.1 T9SS type A sorting domain-containing protein [Mangrovivirga halotolerans]